MTAHSPDDFGHILDGLNAWDALDAARRRSTRGQRFALVNGPKAVAGAGFAGAVLWKRAPGYFGYKTLSVIGVWCLEAAGIPMIVVGVKRLAYQPAFYDPEAYIKLTRRDYLTYYVDDGAPPPADGITASTPYTADQRLALRDWLAIAIARAVSG